MLRVKNILFPTDFSKCAAQALEQVLLLAKYWRVVEITDMRTCMFFT